MSGTLYLVATPIGNLEDMTPRAARVFSEAGFIAAEDTRVTLKLLNHLGLKKELISYHEHNAHERGKVILARIRAGENCALCSDAGMPVLSDPGQALVTDALAEGIPVVPVPAASAAITALAVSGQPAGRFCFEGFLPVNRHQRAEHLEEIRGETRTLIFYEAPHKLCRTLQDLLDACGDRSVTVCRELTKLHEQIWKTTLSAALAAYAVTPPRGEFVLVMAGAAPRAPEKWSLEQAAERAAELASDGLSAASACRQAASESGLAKSDIYRVLTKTGKRGT